MEGKKKGDMVDDVAQLEYNNNKYYASTFIYRIKLRYSTLGAIP